MVSVQVISFKQCQCLVNTRTLCTPDIAEPSVTGALVWVTIVSLSPSMSDTDRYKEMLCREKEASVINQMVISD